MKEKADLTVILNGWRRNYLEEQLETIYSQTMEPTDIWILHCQEHISIESILKKYPAVKRIHSDLNLKYYGRFSIAIHSQTKYTWVLDDDIMPSPTWVETCIRVCETYNSIACSNGRIIPPNDYTPEIVKSSVYFNRYFIGDSHFMESTNTCDSDTLVDFGCSSYFFKTEWLKYFWAIWPFTLETGEDMHLSATCKILGNVSTVVPRQYSAADSGNIKPAYSGDEHASWKKAGFYHLRSDVLKYLIQEKSWQPYLWREAVHVENAVHTPGGNELSGT